MALTDSTTREGEFRECASYVLLVDMPGNDIGSQREPNWRSCLAPCRSNRLCYAVTWTDYQGGTCWFKSTPAGLGAYRQGVVTWVLNSNCFAAGIVVPQCDMVGNDLKAVPSSTYRDCPYKCSIGDGCQAFTRSDYNGGTCWLKTAVAPCVYANNKYSFGLSYRIE